MQTKICSWCKTEKPITEYYKQKRGLYGVHSICKACKSARKKEIYYADVELSRAKAIERYQAYKDDPDYKAYALEKTKKWARDNREYNLEKHRRYWHEKVDKEEYKRKRNASRKIRYVTDPEYRKRRIADGRTSAKLRRYRQRGAQGSHTTKEWEALCEKYGHKCLCCGEKKPLVRDHIVPISKGGSNALTNLQPLCQDCNWRKFTDSTDYRPREGSD